MLQLKSNEERQRFTTEKADQSAADGGLKCPLALIVVQHFTFGSILYSLYLSFTDYNPLSKLLNWLGLQN